MNELNKASYIFKNAKLINFKLKKRKLSQYEIKLRSNSFENSLKRVLLNNYEMQSLITQTKIKTRIRQFHQSFIQEEEDYNKQITQKMIQFGKLLNKIPHPNPNQVKIPMKTSKVIIKEGINNTIPKLTLEALPAIVTKQTKLNAVSNNINSEINNEIELNKHINLLKDKINKFFTYEIKGIKIQSKVVKRKPTSYKYISDEQSRMYFHYFSSDFNINSQPSPEYKFIKIKEESFKVIRALLKVKQIIIEDYSSYNITNESFKIGYSNKSNNLIQYIDFIDDIYHFYSKENEDLLHNYSVVTKCLVNDNKSYLIYIRDLCSISESIILEEKNFRSNIDSIRKTLNLYNVNTYSQM